jgi:hypothetical protein
MSVPGSRINAMSRCHAAVVHLPCLGGHAEQYGHSRDIHVSRCHADSVPGRRSELTLVADWAAVSVGQCLDCGAPSGRRQRCAEHSARHAAKLATERQRRRRADLKPSKPPETNAVVQAAAVLTFELASLWARSDLPHLDTYRPVLRSAAQLLAALKDGEQADET